MNGCIRLCIALFLCCAAPIVQADIYVWTDENGVKHFSNHSPPNGSTVLMKTKEEPYDEAADLARMEADRRERLELARLENERRELEIRLREAELDRRLAEAERIAEDALREAEYYREESRYNSRIIYDSGRYDRCRDYYGGCGYSIYDRRYYRNSHRYGYHKRYRYRNHYRRKYSTTHKRHRYIKKKYGHRKKYGDHKYRKYRDKTGYRHKAHSYQSRLKYNTGKLYRHPRISSSRGSYNGRGGISRGRGGFSRRR